MYKIIRLLTIIFLLLLAACNSNNVKDIEGNSYKTVVIGTNTWMSENLKTEKFNDGTSIPFVKDNDEWSKLDTPAYSWYNNDTENKKTYGALYNWYAVNTKKLCPAGWHVSSDADWTEIYIDGGQNIGGRLKETGTAHWRTPNTDATDERGFHGLPGGYRTIEGAFSYMANTAYWWTSTDYNASSVIFWSLRYKSPLLYKYRSERICGFSVRCVKDK